MKPVRKVNSTSQSCSCTSCIYKSESEQPSIKKYIAHGSRIDRLYFGKYIPLRERKLLNRLVRTRAVYDDLRARLISDSTLSLEKNADLRHRKHHQEIKPIGSSEKSGAILELVDFIDKGAVLGPKSLSECCSCCSCSSNEKILKTKRKEHRQKRVFARSYEGEYNQTMQGRTGDKGFTRTYEREYGRKVHGRMRDRYNRRGVHFKARNIRSDPCTCTLKFSGLIKKHSKALIQKMRQVPLEEPIFNVDEEPVIKKSKLHTMARKSYQKYKEIHKKLESDMKKLNESKENLKKNLQLNAKKSLEQVKQVKDKVKTNIETGFRKSIQAARILQPKGKKYETTEYPEEETMFNIKKDSIVKFKEYLKRKNEIKDWECDMECIPDECVPEKCFRIIKLRRSQKHKRKRDRVRALNYETVSKEVKVGRPQLQKTSSGIQAQCGCFGKSFTKTTATHVRKPMIRIEGGNQVMGQQFETKKVNKVAFKDGNQHIGRSSGKATPPAINRDNIRSYDNKTKNVKKYHDTSNEREPNSLKKDKSDTSSRQAVRIGSSFSFDVEFYKTRPESKESRSDKPSDTLIAKNKIRQHASRRKRKNNRHRHKGSQVSLKSSLQSSQGSLNVPTDQYKTKLIQTTKSSQQMQIVPDIGTSVLLPFECEPFTCQPGECDPHECVKRLSSVKTNTPYDRKSVSSLTVQSTFADKNVAKQIQLKQNVSQASLVPAQDRSAKDEISLSGKQAVRISSTFSFSIEISKKGTQKQSIAPPSTKETIKKVRNKKNYVSPKVKEIKTTSARAYNKAKTNVRRCFCTLKLHKNKNKVHTSTVGTVTALEYQKIAPSMVDKYVETKRNNRIKLKEYKLLPYECEPGICIPGECDPIYCNNILKLRNVPRIRHKTKGSYTSSRKTKSTSSIVSRSASVRAKIVQSSMAPMKQAKTRSPRWPKENLILEPNNLRKTYVDAPGRQAVRVGSSFSFNIEFYKDKLTPSVENKPRIPKEDKYKKRKINQGTYFKDNKNNNSMFTQVMNRDMNIGPPLKRCFCILKLNKNKHTKRIKRTKIPTANTQTVGYAPSTAVNKGTKTKWSHSYNLLPFECEPNTCIPGECNPYLCLEKINLREMNTRDHGVYTNTPEMRSISSYTDNPYKQSAAILVQPKLLDRGTRMKNNNRAYKVKPQQHAERSGDVLGSSNSKQAVRIGSSFNFSIEFSKQMPQVVQLSKYPKNKEAHPAMHTNRGINFAKVRVDHADTQALGPRKRNKGILVHPMLKRCFCTLNLQKKLKKHHAVASPTNSINKFHQPNIYTVSTALTTRTRVISQMFGFHENVEIPQFDQNSRMISISTSSFLLKKCAFNAMYGNFKLCPSVQIPIKLKQPLKINSSLSVDIEIIRDLKPCKVSGLWKIKQPIKLTSYTCTDDTLHLSRGVTSTCNYNMKKNTGISRCLQQCFCAMNVQIAHESVRSDKINMRNKLKPYECEPGICIPGECDPYECQKAIMRRLVRNVHRGSGTKSSNKSISSHATSYVGSDSRSTQFKPHTREHSDKTKIFTEQRRHEYKHRQAVRVGSNFSFNIEFSKNLSQPFRKYDREEAAGTYIRRPVNRKRVSREVQSLKTPSGRHGQSQSTTTSVHRATYTPMMKRCFCTLKLQKKGRLQKENVKLNTRTTEKMPSVESRNAKIGTKYRDITKIDRYGLEAYECEPGICIPGQCDPYKCLERMKQKKELGINTSRFDERSISSMTNGGFINHRTRAVGVKPPKMHDKTTTRFTNSRTMKSNYLPNVESNSRQAVRIGSNFSFNIEFYKGSPQNGSASEYKETRPIGHTKKGLEGNPQYRKKNLKDTNSQSSKSVSNKDTQMEEHYNQTSTMTSSLFRRCFCTAKLQGIEVPNKEHTTFTQKCLCLLGFRNKKDKDYPPANNRVDTAEKRTNTDYRNKVRLHSLKPYECEPGICVPDQCDPYLCHKIIQKRLAKQYSKASETNSVRSQSVSSGIESYRIPKNERTQVRITKQNRKKQYQTRKDISSNKSSVKESKRLVRIGSNFSFNVEFYKDNIKRSDKDSSKVYPSREVPITGLPKRRRLKTAETEIVDPFMRNNEAQYEKKATKTFGSGPPLKRCFCTLKLLNKPAERPNNPSNLNKKNTINVKDKQKITRNAKTQSHKQLKFQPLQEVHERQDLLPYECEPFICIPGQCDPVECLQRIRKRQTKDFGVSTLYHNTRSIGSVASRKKKKDENLQARFKTAAVTNKADKGFVDKPNAVNSLEHSRQAVRIGSNFSFNIEFFKDTGNDGSKNVSYIPKETSRQVSKKPVKCVKMCSKSCNKQVQPLYLKHDADSQSIAVGKQDTQTKMADFKRCFCTLQLKNKEHKPIGAIPDKPHSLTNTKSNHSIVGEFLKKCMCAFKLKKAGKQNQPQINAVKHEIKDVSIQSNDLRRKQIKMPSTTLEPYECEPYVCVPGECDPYECLKRIQKRKVRDFGTDYKRFVKDSATNSIRMQSTWSTDTHFFDKRKLHSRGTSFAAKRRRHSTDTSHRNSTVSPANLNRQVVRIGSNFSFNIEFFKDHGQLSDNKSYKELRSVKQPKIKTQSEQLIVKSKGSDIRLRGRRCQKSQCPYLKRRFSNSASNTRPKRCFCTLKLQKSDLTGLKEKPLPQRRTTENKMTGTKIKYKVPQDLGVYECPPRMCIPGECNPYECLDKMKKRGIARKSRNIATVPGKTSAVSVGNRTHKLKDHKMQSNFKKENMFASASAHNSQPQSMISKSPRMYQKMYRPNKRAVRIGSNFKFNVEFFKEKSQPAVIRSQKIVRSKINKSDSKSYVSKNFTVKPEKFRNINTQMEAVNIKNQSSNTANILKRCFCTLQLQKPTRQMMLRENNDSRGIKVKYPQSFIVGRAAIEPFNKNVVKTRPLKKAHMVKESKSTSLKTSDHVRNVGTRTNKKYLRVKGASCMQCDPNSCPYYNNEKVLENNIKNAMQTILPYTPNKFHKKESKVLISDKHKIKEPHDLLHNKKSGIGCDKCETSMFHKGRRLTAKKSKKSIPKNKFETKPAVKKSFLCRCAKIFCKRTDIKNGDGNKHVLDQRSPEIKLMMKPKKSRNTKFTKPVNEDCSAACPSKNGETEKSILKHTYGMANDKDIFAENTKMRVTFADNTKPSRNDLHQKQFFQDKSGMRPKLCYSCSVNDCPLKVDSKKDRNARSSFRFFDNSKSSPKRTVTHSESADDCQYCELCKRKIDIQEISKGGGDRRSTLSHKKYTESCPCDKEPIITNGRKSSLRRKPMAENFFQKKNTKNEKYHMDRNPVIELHINTINSEIINKDELHNKISHFERNVSHKEPTQFNQSTKHSKKRLGKGATLVIPPKNKISKLFSTKTASPAKPSYNPCTCGSKECSKISKIMRSNRRRQQFIQSSMTPCVCGSHICSKESKKIKRMREHVCSCEETVAKRKAERIIKQRERKELEERLKIDGAKIQKQRLKRIKRNKELERRLRGYKGSSDVVLAVDNFLDIGKLGLTTLGGAVASTGKALMDPKVAYEKCKCKKRDPELVAKQLQQRYLESDAAATAKRVKMRCSYMERVQAVRQKLEENAFTHFLLHLTDKNAKTRKFKRKPVRRRREPLDFECSLYMASLRKRPCLWVYYKCRWFYPHFITMLNVWKQFTDIMLFLLAAVVWSPCILCMEGCRALMCCFFCTG